MIWSGGAPIIDVQELELGIADFSLTPAHHLVHIAFGRSLHRLAHL